jgi:probable rRNA maturation factor
VHGIARPRLRLAVQYAVSARGLPTPALLRRWAKAALERDAVLALRLVGAAEGRRLNAQYRGKDYATNVLTFVYDGVGTNAATDADPLSGDLVLCVPVVRREAREQGKTLAQHCAHLVVHGMLHLQGYDHDRDRTARRMEARETALLATMGIPDPYADAQ